ncbi:D-alanyl-D-alanine carboxypeptidase (penicillin-binding protein 5/6) [Sporobacter termitidis DSM 10068]|uniref:serine-type D-Ala-D-Ala carboxypeptidase n=1 Tax=Sporobacter termitidis DSM 10068 TaxID=1123282 RepID=A0A1M5YFN2_9FIRM|nr:D-alanyl-D-alanine carboxypeptidase family protein [Sporobacter termitidis]SHI10772.1 D-alanyl-D-alanine carboxypeptidase (penicillin-binding protein 5/6) [Sporobacter termitidis DSM 10068]
MKKMISIILVFVLVFAFVMPVAAEDSVPVFLAEDDNEAVDASVFQEETPVANVSDLNISAPSAILLEKETGRVIYEKNADEKLEPASVTKVMTILLIVEAIEAGKITLDDMVTTSAYAASMGGSQIFLEEGEQMSVRDMLKSIVVASANDCAVAMAEYLSGSESVFVAKMNERAKQLGMTNTNFTNCTGLLDDTTHVTTARDIATMSRELIKHDMIKQFTKIWMDSVRNGEFGLNNTNKLIYYYPGATGLKTGFTSRSKYCLSATAERDGVEYIAVILHAETSANRFESAKTLLSYAFANYSLISAYPDSALLPVRVNLGKVPYVQPVIQGIDKILVDKETASTVTKEVQVIDKVPAPVKAGDKLGALVVKSGDNVLGEYPIVAGDSVGKLGWGNIFGQFLQMLFTGGL